MTITQKSLCVLLSYEKETGVFTWIDKRAPNIKPGDAAGTLRNDGYIAIRINGKKYQAHRLAWLFVHGYMPPDQIDHINGTRMDNRIANLRLATSAENNLNRHIRTDNTSGFKGVSFETSSGKWRANASANGKWRSLGRFLTLDAARAAYESFTSNQYGEFKHQGSTA